VREYVNKTDVKNYMKATGHVPDDVVVIQSMDRFFLEVD
jgi:hypothetical protein